MFNISLRIPKVKFKMLNVVHIFYMVIFLVNFASNLNTCIVYYYTIIELEEVKIEIFTQIIYFFKKIIKIIHFLDYIPNSSL